MKRGKTGGRQKGTPNKRTVEFAERLEKLNCDPLELMARMVNGEETQPAKVGVDDDGNTIIEDLPPSWELRASCAKELLQYLYPKRKALELSGPEGGNIPIELVDWATLPKSHKTPKGKK